MNSATFLEKKSLYTEEIVNKIRLLLYFLIRDIRAKYAGSNIGIIWTLVQPLLQIVLFWFVFSSIFRARPYAGSDMSYIYFLLSSLFFWMAFSDGLIKSSHVILENAELIKKVNFPNIILPFSGTLSAYFHHLIGFCIFFLFYIFTTGISPVFLLLIPVVFLQLIFSIGLGLALSSLLPYIRDLSHIIFQLTQALFFLSPILYSIELIPDNLKIFFYLNPLTYFISSYQQIILFRSFPPLFYFIIMTGLAITFFIGGFFIFRKLKAGFADVL